MIDNWRHVSYKMIGLTYVLKTKHTITMPVFPKSVRRSSIGEGDTFGFYGEMGNGLERNDISFVL